MGLSCGAKLAKIILFIFNFIFFLLGAALLGVGIWITVDKSSLVSLANTALSTDDNAVSNTLTSTSSIQIGAYVLIAVGAFTFFVGFCGCCGACTENKCLLGVFAALIILIIIIEIAGAIVVGVYRNKIEKQLKTGLMKLLSQKYIGWPRSLDDNEAISLAWDSVMFSVGCCGLNGPDDFTEKTDNSTYAARWYKDGRTYTADGKTYTNTKLPVMCCKFKSKDFAKNGFKKTGVMKNLESEKCPTEGKDGYPDGCMKSIEKLVKNHATILIGVVAGIICFELFVVICSICLYRAIDD